MFWVTIGLSFSAFANKTGEQAFKANCQACHSIDRFSTGPSLVYIRDNYPLDKRTEFLAWSKNPGKKNPDTIQMPPMGHVGEKGLTQIHDYILFASKHIRERQAKPKFKPFRAPSKPYPFIKRGYLPFTSPASISVVLSPDLTVVWDTTIGSVRYVYPSHLRFNGEKNRGEVRPQILYTETANQPFSLMQNNKVDYQGFDLVKGSPEFIYTLGEVKIRERLTLGKNKSSFIRHYKIDGLTQPLTLDFHHNTQAGKSATIKVSQGQLIKNKLTLSPNQSTKFSVEVSL
jgi:cytochrome c551/c552